jgi:DNA processing protein
VRGDPGYVSRPAVAVVGARNASANGCAFARRLGRELAEAGLVVVSGLARGIDTAAHQGALAAAGATVAVIATGVDIAYPPENAELMAHIAAEGAVVSERPLGAIARAKDFPRRNRVIAGLSLGVVVVEAAPASGSLITARLALDYGREVMAVPGSPLDPRHRGTNQLLRDGAHLVESAADVLAILEPMRHRAEPPAARSERRPNRSRSSARCPRPHSRIRPSPWSSGS